MPLDSINKRTIQLHGSHSLDWAYEYNNSPIRQEIIDLLRSKGGIANYYDEDGWYISSEDEEEEEEEEEEVEEEEKEKEEN